MSVSAAPAGSAGPGSVPEAGRASAADPRAASLVLAAGHSGHDRAWYSSVTQAVAAPLCNVQPAAQSAWAAIIDANAGDAAISAMAAPITA